MSRDDGATALHLYPVTCGHVAVTALLVEAGAELEAMNGEGATPLLLAAATGRSEVVNVLIDAGAVHGRRKRLCGHRKGCFSVPMHSILCCLQQFRADGSSSRWMLQRAVGTWMLCASSCSWGFEAAAVEVRALMPFFIALAIALQESWFACELE